MTQAADSFASPSSDGFRDGIHGYGGESGYHLEDVR